MNNFAFAFAFAVLYLCLSIIHVFIYIFILASRMIIMSTAMSFMNDTQFYKKTPWKVPGTFFFIVNYSFLI